MCSPALQVMLLSFENCGSYAARSVMVTEPTQARGQPREFWQPCEAEAGRVRRSPFFFHVPLVGPWKNTGLFWAGFLLYERGVITHPLGGFRGDEMKWMRKYFVNPQLSVPNGLLVSNLKERSGKKKKMIASVY